MLAIRVFFSQCFKEPVDFRALKVKMKDVFVVLLLITSIRAR